MSTKTGVPVTTIQGWKKRNVIPANRVEEILGAAAEHDIDMKAYVNKAINQNNDDMSSIPVKAIEEVTEDKEKEITAQNEMAEQVVSDNHSEYSIPRSAKQDEFGHRLKATQSQDFTQLAIETEKKAVTKSAVLAGVIGVCVIGAIVVMLFPKMEQVDAYGNRIASLENKVNEVQEQQGMFKGLVPENWSEQLAALKQQMSDTQASVEPALERMRAMSSDVMGQNGGTVAERMEKLEGYVSEITGSTSLSGLFSNLTQMQTTEDGQKMLSGAVLELNDVFSGLTGQGEGNLEAINAAIDFARKQNPALKQTFENVPTKDLQAASMLLAMTQLRSSFKRDNQSFENDLDLLLGMVAEDNTKLRESLLKLAPTAKDGILTPSGLSDEFRKIAGEVVASSLKGEDVSLMEKAQAKMNDILQIEKSGELISGTKAQATVQKAQYELDLGNIQFALDLLNKNLNARELDPIRPWIRKAQAALSAKKVEDLINDAIEMNIGTGYLGGSKLLE
jgi:hypothetical protein